MLEENWVHAPAVVSTGANDKGGSEDSPLCWLGIVIGFDEGEDFAVGIGVGDESAVLEHFGLEGAHEGGSLAWVGKS